MTDITERLRSLYVEQGTNYVQEAASSIERLRAEVRILETALDLAYGLLNSVAEENGTISRYTINEIKKTLPPRFQMSFSAKVRT